MKTCPRCGAVAFDDASICYGCLYRFEVTEFEERDSFSQNDPSYVDQDAESIDAERVDEGALEPEPLRTRTPLVITQAPANQNPPEFCIHLTPRHNAWGGWKWDCSVEIAEKVQHEVVGRHAVQVR